MIRVTIEVDEIGHDFRIVREAEYMTVGGSATEIVGTLVRSAQGSMNAALRALPEEPA